MRLRNRISQTNELEPRVLLSAGAPAEPATLQSPETAAGNEVPTGQDLGQIENQPAADSPLESDPETISQPSVSAADVPPQEVLEAALQQSTGGVESVPNTVSPFVTGRSSAPAEAEVPSEIAPQVNSPATTGTVDLNGPDTGLTNVGLVDFPNERLEFEEVNDLGFTGAGVNVGIISDSFDVTGNGSYAADIASGDLPEGIQIVEGRGDRDSNGLRLPRGDEGRALAQIIHDIAPEANLFFNNAFDNGSNIGVGNKTPIDQSIGFAFDNLVDVGADVIVDDVGSLIAPVYQEGFQAQAINRAVENGVTVFTSAGNEGLNAAEVEFTGAQGELVDFDPTTPGIQGIPASYAEGEIVQTSLHWDDAYVSVDTDQGSRDPNAVVERPTGDFNLYFIAADSDLSTFDPSIPIPLQYDSAQLADDQSGFVLSARTQVFRNDLFELAFETDPYEFIGIENESGDTSEGIWIAQYAGATSDAPETRTVRFSDRSGGITPADEVRVGPTRSGATSQQGISVGATRFTNGETENFSTRGPARLLFDNDGTRLETPIEVPIKIAAPQGVDTTFFGQSFDDGTDFPNFFGTSAAAPVGAAVAALLEQQAREADQPQELTPEETLDILTQTATPASVPAATGAGEIDALAASNELASRLLQS